MYDTFEDENFEGLVPTEDNLPKQKMDLRNLEEISRLLPDNTIISKKNGNVTIQQHNPNENILINIEPTHIGEAYTGIKTPRRTTENRDDFDAEVVRLLKAGLTQAQIADRLGISQSLVSIIKRKYFG